MIIENIKADQIHAMKAKDQLRLNILRYILSKVQNQEIAKQKKLTDDEVLAVLQKQVKELNETLSAAEKGSRTDLVKQAKEELVIVTNYLPKQLSDQELKKAIEKIIAANQEVYNNNQKAIIGLAVKQLRSHADTSRIINAINSFTK